MIFASRLAMSMSCYLVRGAGRDTYEVFWLGDVDNAASEAVVVGSDGAHHAASRAASLVTDDSAWCARRQPLEDSVCDSIRHMHLLGKASVCLGEDNCAGRLVGAAAAAAGATAPASVTDGRIVLRGTGCTCTEDGYCRKCHVRDTQSESRSRF